MLIIDGHGARRFQNTLSNQYSFLSLPLCLRSAASQSCREVIRIAACLLTCMDAVPLQHGPGTCPALDKAPAQSLVPGDASATQYSAAERVLRCFPRVKQGGAHTGVTMSCCCPGLCTLLFKSAEETLQAVQGLPTWTD